MVDISVVIPLHNRAKLIPYTLDSLSPAHHPTVFLEAIVVDDGSTDEACRLVEQRFPTVRVIRQEHGGAPSARNRGLAVARGRATLLLDSDDLVEPGFFEARLRALDNCPRADGVYGPFDYFVGEAEFSEDLVEPRWKKYPVEFELTVRPHLLRLLRGWYVAMPLWRTGALQRVGGQDVSLTVNQDLDLMFRILLSGDGLVGCDGSRALVRHHSGVRQGNDRTSQKKLTDVYHLRRRFMRDLQDHRLFDRDVRTALGLYLYDRFYDLHVDHPIEARKFLDFARELLPAYRMPGRVPVRILASIVGPEIAVRVQERLRAVIKG